MPDDESSIEADSPQRVGLMSRFARFLSGSATDTPEADSNDVASPAPTPSEMRLRVSAFEEARVRDVMIPRVEISAVDVETPLGELIALFNRDAHSRMPVFRGSLDDPLGFVHLKDVISEIADRQFDDVDLSSRPLTRLKREILFVPASMRLPNLMVKMQSTRIHLALVVDEYGGTDGLVSLEDLVEQIVGDIEDEHDEDTAYIVRRSANIWEVDARADIGDFKVESGMDLLLEDFEGEIDTIGGLAFALAGRVPQRAEIIEHPAGADLEILDADLRRIKRLRVRCGSARSPATGLPGDKSVQPDAPILSGDS